MELNKVKGIVLIPVLLFLFVLSGYAQDTRGMYVYPEKNQTEEQQRRDQSNCSAWAEDQYYSNPSPQEQHGRHKTMKGAGIGAGAGALLGGGKGAIIGGAAGAVGGHHRKNKNEQEDAAQASNDFNRAYASCLRGKGYSVE